jgi:hypothetical protein
MLNKTRTISAASLVAVLFAGAAIAAQPVPGAAAPAADVREEASPLAGCTSWDIRELCCPGYCAAKGGSNWSSADKIFDSCIVGLGCKSGHTTGFLSCECPNK